MIGCDIVLVSRFEKTAKEDGFCRRVFTEQELAYRQNSSKPTETLAGLWCAKEACVKALGEGFGALDYRDIEIFHTEKGAPYALIAKRNLTLEVSISHDGGLVFAVAHSDQA